MFFADPPKETLPFAFVKYSSVHPAYKMNPIKHPELTFQFIVESAPNAMMLVNKEGQIVLVNLQAEKLFGFKREELIDQAVEIIIPPRYRHSHIGFRNMFSAMPLTRSMGHNRDLFALKKDGAEFPVEIGLNPLLLPDGLLTLVAIIDITERKLAEKKLENSEKRFRTFFENAPEGMVVLDLSLQRYIMFNTSAIKILRYSHEQLNQMEPGNLSPEFQPGGAKSTDKINRYILNAISGEPTVFEWVFLNSTGKNVLCEIRLVALPDMTKPQILGSFIDITERKEIEKKIRELNDHLEERVTARTQELIEVNKALESFSYSVSHDLRAPVRAIIGFATIIQQEYGEGMPVDQKELFAHIESNAKRMNIIIDDLLTLAKFGKGKLHITAVDMTRLFKCVWTNIKHLNQHHAVLELPELPLVEADMSLIEQVLTNLISNAVKYSSKKDHPIVAVSFKDESDKITFYVKDNGAGFNMEHYNRLFAAFQRLHSMREFEGTGVGLVLVKRIIEKHGGKVGAHAKIGEGATFWFSLPKNINKQEPA